MGGGLETKLLNETEQPPIFRSAHPAINLFFFFFFFSLSLLVATRPEWNTLDLIKRQQEEESEHQTLSRRCRAHFPVFVCLCVCVCGSDSLPGTPRQGLWDASQHKKEKCVYTSADACSPRCFQAPWMTFFFFPLSGRSWEERRRLSHINLKAKLRQDVTSSWTLAIQRFTLSLLSLFASALLWRKKKKKKRTPSSYPAFTILVNPSQLQSVMIRSLINATGKERSKPGKLKTSPYLGLNNTLIELHFHLSLLELLFFPSFFFSSLV